MKRKGLIALGLALVMLFTLAVPVLADSSRGIISAYHPATWPLASGTARISTTHTDQLKFTVTVKGAVPTTRINVRIWDGEYNYIDTKLGYFMTDGRGNGSYTALTVATFSGYKAFAVQLWVFGESDYAYANPSLAVDFK